MRVHALRTALAAAAFAAGTAHAVVPLPRLKVDPAQVTVSGLSSGGFMANQLGYAYASTFKGVGVFAGGPYMCAGHSNYTACMYNATISSTVAGSRSARVALRAFVSWSICSSRRACCVPQETPR